MKTEEHLDPFGEALREALAPSERSAPTSLWVPAHAVPNFTDFTLTGAQRQGPCGVLLHEITKGSPS